MCIYVLVGCTIHLETIKEYFQEKGKKDCRVIMRHTPVYRLCILWMLESNVDNRKIVSLTIVNSHTTKIPER